MIPNSKIAQQDKIKLVSLTKTALVKADVTGAILEVNDYLSFMCGYDSQELMQMNIAQLMRNVQQEEVDSFIRRMCPGKKYQFQVKFLHKNGEIHEAMVHSLRKDGCVYNSVYKLNAQRMLNKGAASMPGVTHWGMGNISHEIRTPMNAIMGFSNILNDNSLDANDRQNIVEMINDNCYRLLNTVDNIADYSLLTQNKITPAASVFELVKFIEDICEAFKMKAEEKKLNIHTRFEDVNTDTIIKTDYTLLKKVISHVVDNAIKFTEQGYVEISCKRNDSFLRFWITDTGIGIPEDKISVIFEEFRQVEESMSRTYQGTGLGLTLAAAFIKLLKGTYVLRSNLKKGTVFYFRIPVS